MAQEAKEEKKESIAMFASDEVIPDVIDCEPQRTLLVNWPVVSLDQYGIELTPTQVKKQPIFSVDDGVDNSKLYTVIMTDPDAKDRMKHEKREWVHFVAINVGIKENNDDTQNGIGKYIFDMESGDILIEYVGSKPPKGTGLHRYVFLVFEQTNKIEIAKCGQQPLGKKGKGRAKWKATRFAANNQMKILTAGNFFQCQNETNKK